MARLTREHQKVFASSAANNGVFGSAQDGTKVLTNNIATLQSKPAFLTGWLNAVIGVKKFPPLEEFQSLNYINTYQLAYLFQEGIPEYHASATYYQNSIVRKSGTYQLFGSIIDNNTGNALPVAPASNASWQFLTDLSAAVADATTAVKGIQRNATAAEAKAGVLNNATITPDVLAPLVVRTGMDIGYWGTTAPTGWVLASGRTIGSASSGATERANADTVDLYTLLWNSVANAQLPIQDSLGSATTRGANAASDFAANKRLPLPDMRGRTGFGKDDMGGTPAGRLSGQPFGINGLVMGSFGGQEAHTLTVAELATHNHKYNDQGYTLMDRGNNITTTVNGINVTSDSALAGITATDAGYLPVNTVNEGSSSPHNVLSPGIVRNVIIKL